MKKNKGFTLIELLAVIIILAAIALIIAPLVLDIIREQQKKTFKESINGILRSSRLEIVNSGLSFPVTFTYSDGKLLSPTGKELKVTGKIPEGSGSVRYNSEDDIDLAIHDNSWCGTYSKTSKEVNVNELDGECVVQVAYTPEKCFTFDSSTGTITKYKKSDNDCPVDVVIPETIGGVTVKKIGAYAFAGDGLSDNPINSVVFPSGLEIIENEAFYGNALCSVAISNLEKHGIQPLKKKIQSVEVVSSRIELATASCGDSALTEVDFSKATSLQTIGDYAFGDNQLTSVTIPNSVTSIGNSAFDGNQLVSVDLSRLTNLETIGSYAFADNQLTSVTIPSNVTSIGGAAFNNNQLSDSEAFIYARKNDGSVDTTTVVSYGGAKRDNVVIPSNVTSIGQFAFSRNQLTSVTIPNSVTSIGYGAFKSNQLTSVTIKGKSSSSDFVTYDPEWGWASGYNDSNIIWNG